MMLQSDFRYPRMTVYLISQFQGANFLKKKG